MITSLSHALAEAREAELRRVAAGRREAGPRPTRRRVSAGNVAFLSVFAAQAGVLTLTPILPGVAREFGISTAAAGQLRTLAGLSGGIAALAVVPGLLLSTATFTLLVLVATTRTVAGSAFALYVTREHRLAVMGVRASTAQFGYLLGGAAGGAALAAGGYPALGFTLAALFALRTTPHIRTPLAERAGERSPTQAPAWRLRAPGFGRHS